MQLCSACRTSLAKRAFPVWIKIGFGLIAALSVFALTRVPAALSASIAFERGQKNERAGKYDQAGVEYLKVIKQFPEFNLAVARLGISQYRAGDVRAAAETFSKLDGQPASAELVREVNAVIEDMKQRANR